VGTHKRERQVGRREKGEHRLFFHRGIVILGRLENRAREINRRKQKTEGGKKRGDRGGLSSTAGREERRKENQKL